MPEYHLQLPDPARAVAARIDLVPERAGGHVLAATLHPVLGARAMEKVSGCSSKFWMARSSAVPKAPVKAGPSTQILVIAVVSSRVGFCGKPEKSECTCAPRRYKKFRPLRPTAM